MKKFLASALLALMVFGVGVTGAECCCRGYCYQDCDDNNSGDYCGRYGCGR